MKKSILPILLFMLLGIFLFSNTGNAQCSNLVPVTGGTQLFTGESFGQSFTVDGTCGAGNAFSEFTFYAQGSGGPSLKLEIFDGASVNENDLRYTEDFGPIPPPNLGGPVTLLLGNGTNGSGDRTFTSGQTYTMKVTFLNSNLIIRNTDDAVAGQYLENGVFDSSRDLRFGIGTETILPAGSATINAEVWDDQNANRSKDAGEPIIDGVTVQLLDVGNTALQTTTTSGGIATFSVAPGTYKLKFVAPADHKFTPKTTNALTQDNRSDATESGTYAGYTASFAVADGETVNYVDAGLWSPGSLEAEIWDDQNANRSKDAGEPLIGLPVTVDLLESDNSVIATVTTSTGVATFTKVVPADRQVKLRFRDLPDDHKFTHKTTSSLTQDNRSDATESGGWAGYTGTFAVTRGNETIKYVDAGLWSPGSLVAEVWDDQNANRSKDAGEPLIDLDVTVDLLETDNQTIIATTTTVNGVATFTKVVPADRQVKLRFRDLPADHKFTHKTTNSLQQDNRSDATESGGWAGFTGNFAVTRGNETISYVDAGLWSPGSLVAEVWDDQNANRSFDASEPLIDLPVTVDLLETDNSTIIATTTTVNGVATFTKVVPADRQVKLRFRELPADHKFTHKTTNSLTQDNRSDATESGGWAGYTGNFAVTRGNETIQYVDAGLWSPGSLVAEVWDDQNANRSKDAGEPFITKPVTVDIMETDNQTIIATTTTVGGVATFTKVVPADRQVKLRFRELPADHKFTHKTTNSLTQDNRSDAVESGGWAGYTGNFAVTRGNETISYVDAGLWAPGEVQAQIFMDHNGNRAKDANEEGVFGFEVKLMESNNQPAFYPAGHPLAGQEISGITQCGGVATFYLPADRSFKLKFVANGATFTAKTTNSITQDNRSDAIQSGGYAGFTETFAADRGSDVIDFVDAGFTDRGTQWTDATIETFVWDDRNADGKQNGYESGNGIEGVKVRLLDQSGNECICVETDAAGVAAIPAISAKNYRLDYITPQDHKITHQNQGSNEAVDSDPNGSGLTSLFSPSAGQTITDIDAGMWTPGRLIARAWDDQNGDGKQNGYESANNLAGVTVALVEKNSPYHPVVNPNTGNEVTGITGPDGLATLDYVPADREMRLIFGILVDHKRTHQNSGSNEDVDSDANGDGLTQTFKADRGSQTHTHLDAGFWSPGQLVARAWDDQNGDGKQNGYEDGNNIEGITVALVEKNAAGGVYPEVMNPNTGQPVTGITNSDGLATLDYVPADREMRLIFGSLIDHKRTHQNSGSNEAVDSDANGNGLTQTFKADRGNQTHTHLDAGFWTPGQLIARAWDDQNGDGKQNGYESTNNLAGVTVALVEKNSPYHPVVNPNTGNEVTGITGPDGLATLDYVPADREMRLIFGSLIDHKRTHQNSGSNEAVDSDANGDGLTQTFKAVKGNQTHDHLDAGFWSPGQLIARAWDDQNGDGKQNGYEDGNNLAGVTVALVEKNAVGGVYQPVMNPNTNLPVEGITDGAGLATLSYVPADREMRLIFGTLVDHKRTHQNSGSNESVDSDADGNGLTQTFKADRGNQTHDHLDAGFWSPGIVEARVWLDANGDGRQNGYESDNNIYGVRVDLVEKNPVNGSYQPVINPNTGQPVFAYTACGTGIATLDYVPADREMRLQFELLDASLTSRDAGSNDDVDSDPNGNGITATFKAVKGNQTHTHLDAGFTSINNYYVIDTDSDNVPDFLDKYPNDNTNNGMGVIYSRVWDDLDGDGKQDSGEPDLEVTDCDLFRVNLRKSNNDFLQSAYVNPINGHVAFFDVPLGLSVRMQFVRPGGYSFGPKDASSNDAIDSDVNPSNGYTDVFSFSSASVNTNTDAAVFSPGAIETFVWDDRDGDGKQDAGEPGISGVNVQLRRSNNNDVLGTAVTNANGIATLADVPTDIPVRVSYSRPAGHTFAPQDASSNNSIDSDPSAGTPSVSYTAPIQLTKGNQLVTSVDAGLFAPGSIETFVWDDLDGDGKQDAGEPGIAGVQVNLRRANNNDNLGSAVTDANGIATLANVPTDIPVRVSYNRPAGHTFAPQDASSDNSIDSDAAAGTPGTSYTAPIQLTKGSQLVKSVDAGLFSPGVIETFVWDDLDGDGKQDFGEPGIAGVNVQLRRANNNDVLGNAVTDVNGVATLANVPTDIPVRVSYSRPGGHTFTAKDASSDNSIDSDAGAGTPSVSYTDAIQLSKGNQLVKSVDAGLFSPGTIETFVWDDLDGDGKQDADEPGIPNVQVNLRKANNNDVLGGAVTNSDGIAVLANVPTDIPVRVSYNRLAGHTFTAKDASSDNSIDSDAAAGTPNVSYTDAIQLTKGDQLVKSVDAGLFSPGTIETFVWDDLDGDGKQDAGEPGIEGVNVQLRKTNNNDVLGTAVTGSDGIATLTNVPTDIPVRVSYSRPAGHTFTAKDASSNNSIDSDAAAGAPNVSYTDGIQLSRGNQLVKSVDAGLFSPGTIETFVWDDLDGDGKQDAGEPGIEGVTVQVRRTNNNDVLGFADTNADGIASIPGVPTDIPVRLYYVTPPGYNVTTKDASSDNSIDSDVYPNGYTDNLQLIKGNQTVTNVDAGYQWANLSLVRNNDSDEDKDVSQNAPEISEVVNTRTSEKSGLDNEREKLLEMVSELYPNPARDLINLDFQMSEDTETEYRVVDMHGRVVMNGEMEVSRGTNRMQLSVRELPAGQYALQLFVDRSFTQKRFIVIK